MFSILLLIILFVYVSLGQIIGEIEIKTIIDYFSTPNGHNVTTMYNCYIYNNNCYTYIQWQEYENFKVISGNDIVEFDPWNNKIKANNLEYNCNTIELKKSCNNDEYCNKSINNIITKYINYLCKIT